jgi:hypothetical protein
LGDPIARVPGLVTVEVDGYTFRLALYTAREELSKQRGKQLNYQQVAQEIFQAALEQKVWRKSS